jgi:plastocyanin
MRRVLFLVVSLVLAGGLVTACGKDDTATNDNANTDSGMDMDMDGHGDNSPVADGAREIDITAEELSFDPPRIEVAVGEKVAITLHAGDTLHDMRIDELDLHVSADAGTTATGGFTADTVGEYPFYCSVEGHRESGMEGTLVVS